MSSPSNDSTVNRSRHYNGVDLSLRVPLTQSSDSSNVELLPPKTLFSSESSNSSDDVHQNSHNINTDQQYYQPPPSRQSIVQPQPVNWSHTSDSTFQQIATNKPVDPNVVIVPKHPLYLSKLYRPLTKQIASNEGFATLRVETLAMCCLFIATASVFSPSYAPIIIMCVLACLLCVFGFIGALRQIKGLVYFFWFGLGVWSLIMVLIAFLVLFLGDHMKNDAIIRCQASKSYFLKFNSTTQGIIDCNMNTHICFQQCVNQLTHHLSVAYLVFGGLIIIFAMVYFLRANSLRKSLLWTIDQDENENSTSDRTPNELDESRADFDDTDDDDDEMVHVHHTTNPLHHDNNTTTTLTQTGSMRNNNNNNNNNTTTINDRQPSVNSNDQHKVSHSNLFLAGSPVHNTTTTTNDNNIPKSNGKNKKK